MCHSWKHSNLNLIIEQYDLLWLDQMTSPPNSIILWFVEVKVNQAIPQVLLRPATWSLSFSFVLTFLQSQTLRKRQQIYEAGALSFPYVKSQLTVL